MNTGFQLRYIRPWFYCMFHFKSLIALRRHYFQGRPLEADAFWPVSGVDIQYRKNIHNNSQSIQKRVYNNNAPPRLGTQNIDFTTENPFDVLHFDP